MEDIIKLEYCTEVVNSWGDDYLYVNDDLYKLLITPEDWNDDQTFIADEGSYYIEDLIGKTVQVGTFIFKVQED